MRQFIIPLFVIGMLILTATPALAGPVVFSTMSSATVRVDSYLGATDGATMNGENEDVTTADLAVYDTQQSTLVQYDISIIVSGNGAISCPASVEHGFATVCTVTPDSGNRINAVSGCRGTLAGNLFTTGPITAPCTVIAAFNIDLPPVAGVTPNPADFGTYILGDLNPTLVFLISNDGIGNPLTVSGISKDGLTPEQFTLALLGNNPCPIPPFTLNAGMSCTVSLTFFPTSIGQKSAVLQVSSNDPQTPVLSAPVTAAAVNQFQTISLAFSGAGGGSVAFSSGPSCSANCDQSIPHNTTVTLTPTADADAAFIGWSGCDSISGTVCSVTMTAGRSVTATFALQAAAGSFSWRPTGGPGGGAVNALAVNPAATATIYAGTDAGVYKTTDSGTTWGLVGLASSKVNALAVDSATPSTVYAGTDAGVFKSADAGGIWTAQGLATAKVQALAINPATPATLYAGTETALFRTSDGGSTWVQAALGSTESIRSLAVDSLAPTTVYAGTVSGKALKTTDGGVTWGSVTFAKHTETLTGSYCASYCGGGFGGGSYCCGYQNYTYNIDVPDPVLSLAIDPVNPAVIVAGSSMMLYKSANGGTSWEALSLSRSINSLATDGTNPATIFAGTPDGIFRTTDGGATWGPVNSDLTTLDVRSLLLDPIGFRSLYAGTAGGGVFNASFASTIALSPSLLDFGTVATHSISTTLGVTVNNPSTADLVVAAVTLTGTNGGEFIVSPGTCVTLTPTLAPGTNCILDVTFTPTTVGNKAAVLQVESNASNAPTASINLAGIAYDPPPFGFISVSDGATYTNSADVTLTLNAIDNSGQVADMRFSNNNTSWSSWELYTTTKAWTLMPLGGDGGKTVFVQFRDATGNASGSFADTITLDTTPPIVTITSKPADLYPSKSGVIAFTASEAAVFSCSLDGASAVSCSSPWTFTNLGDGSHTLNIMAIDLAGMISVPAASHTWTIDTTPPDSTITAKPANPTNQTGGSFSFSASEADSVYQCSLDGAAWGACSAPFTFSALVDGSHTFRVRSTDQAGNLGQPAIYSWTVNTSTPQNVKIQNLGSYFATIGDAFGAFTSGTPALILGRDMDYSENLILDRCGEVVTLEGGYSPDFTVRTGQSRVIGSLVIICGTLVADGITIQ